MTAAVNESLAEDTSLEEACIAWICDNNTVMETRVEKGISIRNVAFTLIYSFTAERDIIPEAYPPILRPLDERDIQRTYFAQEETYVSTWNECFKSETKNFIKNKYSLHEIGRHLLI